MLVTITIIYNAQLIFYHYERVFLHTAGVEGQVAMSVVFAVPAYPVTTVLTARMQLYGLALLSPTAASFLPLISNVLAAVVTLSTLHLDWFYVQRFTEKGMLLEHLLFLAVCCTVGGLYWTNACTQLSFFMIIL